MRVFGLLLLAPTVAAAQPVVVSPEAERVAVTAYRNVDRAPGEELELDWVEGYALITETRTLDLPAGESEVRFEGVAGTLIPSSVIVRGLGQMPNEQNYDARLLSPGALMQGALGGLVTVQRTNRRTGEVVEYEAIVRSTAQGLVVESAQGVEALKCSGLPEALIFDEVPEGLGNEPTLSIRTRQAQAGRREVSISYLAGQFDWDANYVATLAEDGEHLDLFAWLTLANGNDETFEAARLSAVAGELNREEATEAEAYVPRVSTRCWPIGSFASPLPVVRRDGAIPPPPASSPVMEMAMAEDQIIVTGSRVQRAPAALVAEQEDLGDLKLYRVPERVDVAANAQKQITLFEKERVPVKRIYGTAVRSHQYDFEPEDSEELQLILRMENVEKEGLGLPLPEGTLSLYEPSPQGVLLSGLSSVTPTAVGQDFELDFGTSPDVQMSSRWLTPLYEDEDQDWPVRTNRVEHLITNARPVPVEFEILIFQVDGEKLRKVSQRVERKDELTIWRGRIEAGGTARLRYDVVRPERPAED